MNTKITINQWHELPDEKKDVVRKWAVANNFGLDIAPSRTSATCDYAALLTVSQMKMLIKEMDLSNESPASLPEDHILLWDIIKKKI